MASLWTSVGPGGYTAFTAALHTPASAAVAGQLTLTLPTSASSTCMWEFNPGAAPLLASRATLWLQLFRPCDTPAVVLVGVALAPGPGMVQQGIISLPSADRRAVYHSGSDSVLVGARQVLDAGAAIGVSAFDATSGLLRWAATPAAGSGGVVITPAMDVWALPPALAGYAPVMSVCCSASAPASVAVEFRAPDGSTAATWALAPSASMPADASFLFLMTPSSAVVAAYVPTAGGPVASLSAATRLDTPWVLSPPNAMAILAISATTADAVYWVGTPPGSLQLAAIPPPGASPSGTASPSPTGSRTGSASGTPTPLPPGESPSATGSSSATGSPTGTPGPPGESPTGTGTGSATPSPAPPGESPSSTATGSPTGTAAPQSDSPTPSVTRPAVPLSPSPPPPPAPFRAIAQVPLPPGSSVRCVAPTGDSATLALLLESPTDGGRIMLVDEASGAVRLLSGPGSAGSAIGGPCPSADGLGGTAVSSQSGTHVYFTWVMPGRSDNFSFFIAVSVATGRQAWQWSVEAPSPDSVVAAPVMDPPPGAGLLLLLKSMLDGEPPRVAEVDQESGAVDYSLTIPMIIDVDTIRRSAVSARGEHMALLLSRDDGTGQTQFSVVTYDVKRRQFTPRTVLPLPPPQTPPGCAWEPASDGSGLLVTMAGAVWAHLVNPCDTDVPSLLAGVAPDGETTLPVAKVPSSFTAYYHLFTETIIAGPVSVVPDSGVLALDAATGVPKWPQAAPPSTDAAYVLDSAAVTGLNIGVPPWAATTVPALLVAGGTPVTSAAFVWLKLADGSLPTTPSPLPTAALPGGGVPYRVYTTSRITAVVASSAGRTTLLPANDAAGGTGTSSDWWGVQQPATALGSIYWSPYARNYAVAVASVATDGAGAGGANSVTLTLAFMPGPGALTPTEAPSPASSPAAGPGGGGSGVPDAGAAVGGVFGVLAALTAAIVFFRWHAARHRAAPLAAPGLKDAHTTVNLAARAASLSARTSAAAIGAPPAPATVHAGGAGKVDV